MNKVENNQLFANFYHSNTLIFIRRNVIYVFTFHNPFHGYLYDNQSNVCLYVFWLCVYFGYTKKKVSIICFEFFHPGNQRFYFPIDFKTNISYGLKIDNVPYHILREKNSKLCVHFKLFQVNRWGWNDEWRWWSRWIRIIKFIACLMFLAINPNKFLFSNASHYHSLWEKKKTEIAINNWRQTKNLNWNLMIFFQEYDFQIRNIVFSMDLSSFNEVNSKPITQMDFQTYSVTHLCNANLHSYLTFATAYFELSFIQAVWFLKFISNFW